MRFNRIVLFLCLFSVLLSLGGCGISTKAASTEERSFLDELTFLGDSTTAHMQQRSRLRKEQIWAAKHRYLNLDTRITTALIEAPDTGEEQTIAEVAARLEPAYLVITLGVDYGVYYYRDKPETFRLYYEKLLNTITKASSETTLILQSIFPVARTAAVITNEMIQRANEIIREIARDRGLVFVDQTPVLCDDAGYLRPEYCYSEDGIHLTTSAYEAVLNHLNSFENRIKENAI